MPSQVIGNGPVGFTDSTGNQKFIPLSALEFLDGQISAEKWPLYSQNKAIVDALLADLVEHGFLRAGPSPPAKPAMVLQAAVPGAAGNTIQVTFSKFNTSDPNNTTFEATITSTDIYPELSWDDVSPAFITTVLGTDTLIGTHSGLIRVKDASNSSQPKIKSYSLTTNGNSAPKAFAEIEGDPAGTAFTVEAWKAGDEGKSITVTISEVDSGTKTFTLEVKLNHTITGIKMLPKDLEGSGIFLEVKKPGVGDFATPAPGTVELRGGSDAKAAVRATTTILATP
jgi:hypothetical protein